MNISNNSIKREKNIHITKLERYRIETLLNAKVKRKDICKQLSILKRTLNREIKRGQVLQKSSDLDLYWKYDAWFSHNRYEAGLRNKGTAIKLEKEFKFAEYITNKIINEKHSPEASLILWKKENPENIFTICVKTLYNYINNSVFFEISNNELLEKKKKKRHVIKDKSHKRLQGRSIEERADYINMREEFGHWEMDCVIGKREKGEVLLVLTERLTSKEIIIKMESKTTASVVRALKLIKRKYNKKFKKIFKTITVDNGSEFYDCISMEKLGMLIYYCHPYSSWERGLNENQNKIIRRFIPKSTKMENYSKSYIKYIETWMNNYPRRRFGLKTPQELFDENLKTA